MKNNKKKIIRIIEILLIISLIISTLLIYSTYARYFEEINTNYGMNIKRWNLKINNNEIQNSKELTKIMQPNFIHNNNMKDGIIVPGREGYFQIDLDYSQVDLPFDFKFEYKQNAEKILLDLQIFKYTIENSKGIIEEKQTNNVNITIDPNDKTQTEKTKTIKVYFKWSDEATNKMDNYQDTIFEGITDKQGGKNTMLNYKVTLTFKQHI